MFDVAFGIHCRSLRAVAAVAIVDRSRKQAKRRSDRSVRRISRDFGKKLADVVKSILWRISRRSVALSLRKARESSPSEALVDHADMTATRDRQALQVLAVVELVRRDRPDQPDRLDRVELDRRVRRVLLRQ